MSSTPYVTSNTVTQNIPGPVVAFYDAAGSTQRALAAQGALTVSAMVSAGAPCYGFASAAQGDALVAQVKEMAATLTALGLWKGGA